MKLKDLGFYIVFGAFLMMALIIENTILRAYNVNYALSSIVMIATIIILIYYRKEIIEMSKDRIREEKNGNEPKLG